MSNLNPPAVAPEEADDPESLLLNPPAAVPEEADDPESLLLNPPAVAPEEADGPESLLLNLPAELRNMIYGYVLTERNLWLGGTPKDRDVTFEPVINPAKVKQANQIQFVCQMLWQETRGLELEKATLSGVEWSFMNFINLNDKLRNGHVRKVKLTGLNMLVARRDTESRLFPILDWCLEHPKASVRIEIGDFVFEGIHNHNTFIFIRTGCIIRAAFRDANASLMIPADKKLVELWRGGRKQEELDVANIRFAPRQQVKFDDKKFRKHVHQLVSVARRNSQIKKIMAAYGGDEDKLMEDVCAWHSDGI
jgi:hypothetical protein